MDAILTKILEQSPVIVSLSLGVYALWSELKNAKKELADERKASREELKDMKDAHALELKELNAYIRERDLDTQDTLNDVVGAVESIHLIISEKLNSIN